MLQELSRLFFPAAIENAEGRGLGGEELRGLEG